MMPQSLLPQSPSNFVVSGLPEVNQTRHPKVYSYALQSNTQVGFLVEKSNPYSSRIQTCILVETPIHFQTKA